MNVDANVRKILVALFKKWQLIVIIAVIGGMLGYFYTAKFTTLTYTSSVEFLAEADDPTDEIVSTGSSSSNEYARTSNTSKMNYAIKMLPTYIEIFNTNKFDNRVANDLNKRINANYTPSTIKNALTIESITDTAMFQISVNTTDKDLSYEIAHQLEITLPKVMEETNKGLVKASVQDEPTRAVNSESLGYPKKIALGAIIGAFAAAAYIILRNILEIRIKTEEELIEKYNIPVLGSIPNFESKGSSTAKVAGKED